MSYDYDKVINEINMGKIKTINFSIRDYSHYKNCTLNCHFSSDYEILIIELSLTQDGTESIHFHQRFNGEHKIFNLGRKGRFSLKQLWNKVDINEIKYNEK